MADISFYRDEIKLLLTGGVLELELDDDQIDQIINSAFREIQRYIDQTVIETIDYSDCIDLNPRKINSITKVYRAEAIGVTENASISNDPAYMMQFQLFSPTGSMMYNYNTFTYNYGAWNAALQIRNTLSTDLAFRYDRNTNKLYINTIDGIPRKITIEYVPRFDNVAQITSDFWIDVLMKMSLALTKIVLGRIRSRYTQSNALWTQDGTELLQEGTTELTAIREKLIANSNLFYPID